MASIPFPTLFDALGVRVFKTVHQLEESDSPSSRDLDLPKLKGDAEPISDALSVRTLTHADGSHGKGVFASRDIDIVLSSSSKGPGLGSGTVLLKEPSILTYFPQDHESLGGEEDSELRLGRFLMLHLHKSCSAKEQEAFLELHDCTPDAEELKKKPVSEGGGPANAFVLGLVRRFQTNAITVLDDQFRTGRAIFPELARINHSCFPNCDVQAEQAKKKMQKKVNNDSESKIVAPLGSIITGRDETTGEYDIQKPPSAMRTMKAGDSPAPPSYEACLTMICDPIIDRLTPGKEITISYVDPALPFAEREKILSADYRFKIRKEDVVDAWYEVLSYICAKLQWESEQLSDRPSAYKDWNSSVFSKTSTLGLTDEHIGRLEGRIIEEVMGRLASEELNVDTAVEEVINIVVEEDDRRRQEEEESDDENDF